MTMNPPNTAAHLADASIEARDAEACRLADILLRLEAADRETRPPRFVLAPIAVVDTGGHPNIYRRTDAMAAEAFVVMRLNGWRALLSPRDAQLIAAALRADPPFEAAEELAQAFAAARQQAIDRAEAIWLDQTQDDDGDLGISA